MKLTSNSKIYIILLFILFLLIPTFPIETIQAQIKIFGRSKNEQNNNETIFRSDTRIKIDLSGSWRVTFDNSELFTNINVPFATEYRKSFVINRNFDVSDSLLSKFNFIFYAESINYESEVTINNVIVSRNNGGSKIIFNEIQENLIQKNNNISIRISGELDNSKTFPLASQVNYARNYSGVLANIYIFAVPKIYISESLIRNTFTGDNVITFTNNISVNSLYIDTLMLEGNSFSVKTDVIRISDTAKIFESPETKFDPKNYQNYKLSNTITLKNIDLWSPENPTLYLISTSIYYKDELIDNVIYETGFKKTDTKGSDIFINGSPITLKGINYFEDQPLNASALDYSIVEKDLRNIKELGFNTIRVPGKTAHPFVVRAAQRIGLYVLQEYPFNEIPSSLLKDEHFIKDGIDFFSNIIKRDLYSPAILAWGIGNDFDVTIPESEKYAIKIKEAAKLLDNRPLYYTTKNIANDKIAGIMDLKGYNITDPDFNTAKTNIEKINKTEPVFISSLGVSTDNNNRNGYGDFRSAEYQAKYLTEIISSLNPKQGFVISSYADYNAEAPLIIHYDESAPALRTNGIYDYGRNPKYSNTIIRRMLNNQGYQKIPEGNVSYTHSKSSNYFVVFGLLIIILLLFALSKIRYFKDNIVRSVITPRNFLYTVKEQNDVPNFQSIILIIILSSVLSLLFSSILYNIRIESGFELILSKFINNSSLIIFAIDILNNPVLLFVLLFVLIVILFFLTYLLTNLLIKLLKRKTILRPSFAVTIWSFVLFIIFLPFGIIFSKTLDTNSSTIIYYTMYIYLGVLAYSLIKLINGVKYVFDLGLVKSYFYGVLLIAVIFTLNYYYIFSYKSVGIFIDLINSYN
ncbi:MAG: glycoside hydrolase family 2 TIM barrel-domain containing protein [Candidatus Kapaibacterium sp.]